MLSRVLVKSHKLVTDVIIGASWAFKGISPSLRETPTLISDLGLHQQSLLPPGTLFHIFSYCDFQYRERSWMLCYD